jgi:hypothetical protein
VTRRSRAVAAGLFLAALYVVGATVAASLGSGSGRPLLDGFTTPLPYRWVSPPPALASGNKPPAGGRFTVALTDKGSEARVLFTSDLQATLILEAGAIAPSPGQSAVKVSIEPLDPHRLGPPPRGVTIVGNAYAIRAVYSPSGLEVVKLAGPARVALVYPATAGLYHHRMLQSSTGSRWRTLTTTDTATQLQAISDVATPGVFAVGQVGKPSSGGSLARSLPALLLTVAALAVAGWFGVTAARDRLRARRTSGASGTRRGRNT